MGRRKLEAHVKRDHGPKIAPSSPLAGRVRKPGKMREQAPMDAPFQVPSTSTYSQQVDYTQPPHFGPHEGEWGCAYDLGSMEV
jgi:hypothetical protein